MSLQRTQRTEKTDVVTSPDGAAGAHGRRSPKVDIIVIGVIVAIALVAFVGVKLYGKYSTGDMVQITGADGLSVELPLDQDASYVATTSLGTNTIVIENRTVRVTDADCKNKICEQTGTIDTPGQTIVCLPHHLVVKIVSGSGDDSQEFDTLSN